MNPDSSSHEPDTAFDAVVAESRSVRSEIP